MNKKTKFYLAAIYFSGILALRYMFMEYAHIGTQLNWLAIAYFMVLSFITESLQVGYKDTSISIGFSVNLASFLLFGPFAAAIVIAVGFFFRITKKKETTVHVMNTPLYKSLYNVFSMILCAFVASRVVFLFYDYSIFYYFSDSIDVVDTVLPAFIYAIGFSAANSLFISLLFVTMTPNSFFHYFTENLRMTFISSLSIGLISGIIFAILYETLGVVGSLLFFLPILYARYTFQLYVDMKDADIGKIGVPDTILNKPGQLNAEEYKICQRHAEIGHSIVHGISYLNKCEEIIRSHHEHFDGTGYPDGLAGKSVALETYIVALADAYDAMSSDRPYRTALPEEKILAIIAQERGTQFHPEVVDVFLSLKKDGNL